MQGWKSGLAILVATGVVIGPAWAQTTMDKDKGMAPGMPKSTDTMKADDKAGMKADQKDMKAAEKADKTEMKAEKKMDTMGRHDRMARGGNRDQVMAAQQALKDKGHDPGAIDGRMGPKTRAALKAYQKAEGMKDTGRLDTATMTKLGVDMKTGSAASTSPAASPAMPDKADEAKPSTKTSEDVSPTKRQTQ